MTIGDKGDAGVYTDLSGLTRLRAQARDQSPESIEAAAKQFEALFIQMMLQSMREAGDATGDDLFGSDQERLYRDMFDKQLSLDMAGGHGIGLADVLVRQLKGGLKQAEPLRPAETLIMPERPRPGVSQEISPVSTAANQTVLAASQPAAEPAAFKTPEEFVAYLWPHAKTAGEKIGVDPRALLAQAALETGWGRSVIRRPDGSSSHNLFNIKADHRWDGPRAVKETLEYRDGIAAREKAPFRAYGSYAESFTDYVAFLQSSPRYREALEDADDARAFVQALQRAGYATDPEYAAKIQRIIDRGMVADVKNPLPQTIT